MSKRALAVGMVSTLILFASVTECRAQESHPPLRVRLSSVALGSLYVSTAVLQGLDVHSTLSSIHRGADETNPLLKGLVQHPAAFVAVKASVGAGTILAARSIARKNKIAAIAALVAIDSLYVIAVNHNYQIARRMR